MRIASILAFTACSGPVSDELPSFSDGGPDTPAVVGATHRWAFDDEAPGPMPAPWFDVLGDWQIEDGTVVQMARHRDSDYPRALVEGLQFANLKMSVKCRMESGETDRACGIVFRAADSDNYYVTRANTLEDNIRLYRVIGGSRAQFASVNRKVDSDRWYTFAVEALGNRIIVSWDGEPIIDATDDTFASGVIGLWTKADSITRFDDLEATAIE